MKKTLKKLTLHRETLCSLNDLRQVAGEAATLKTICATACYTNCAACNLTISVCAGQNCTPAGF